MPFRYKYLPALLDMLNNQKYLAMSTVNMKNLPKIGYMVLRNNHPVAAGFLRRVEGGYAQFDTFASNPLFGSQIRHLALNLVIDSLLSDAKTLKLRGIIAFTEDAGILLRAKSIGFAELSHSLIGLKLEK